MVNPVYYPGTEPQLLIQGQWKKLDAYLPCTSGCPPQIHIHKIWKFPTSASPSPGGGPIGDTVHPQKHQKHLCPCHSPSFTKSPQCHILKLSWIHPHLFIFSAHIWFPSCWCLYPRPLQPRACLASSYLSFALYPERAVRYHSGHATPLEPFNGVLPLPGENIKTFSNDQKAWGSSAPSFLFPHFLLWAFAHVKDPSSPNHSGNSCFTPYRWSIQPPPLQGAAWTFLMWLFICLCDSPINVHPCPWTICCWRSVICSRLYPSNL